MRYVGKNIDRVDAVAKVTGEPIFIADLTVPNMLFAKVLRAGVPHARIKKVDKSEAETMPGVVKVLSGQDRPMLFGAEHCERKTNKGPLRSSVRQLSRFA